MEKRYSNSMIAKLKNALIDMGLKEVDLNKIIESANDLRDDKEDNISK